MKVLIGWLLGLATAWAALAIWQRLEFPDIDYPHPGFPESQPDDLDRIVYGGEKPYVHLNNKFPPPPVTDPNAFTTRRGTW